jgi:NADPH:quinone reductase-like Zn-dependent oxidoreductase
MSAAGVRAYRIHFGRNIDDLHAVRVSRRAPGVGEVCVRVMAVALNYRDLLVATGGYFSSSAEAVVPCSDCAGVVLSVGKGVTRVKVGDRVAPAFFPNW